MVKGVSGAHNQGPYDAGKHRISIQIVAEIVCGSETNSTPDMPRSGNERHGKYCFSISIDTNNILYDTLLY